MQSADLLVLNKVDLVPEADWPAIEARLREIEPEAPLVRAVQGDVALDLLFPPDAGELDRRGEAPAPRPHSHEHFETAEWNPERGMPQEAIEAHLARAGLLRAKGFVETDEGVRLVQVVGRRVEITEPSEPAPEPLIGRVVLIRRSKGAHDHG